MTMTRRTVLNALSAATSLSVLGAATRLHAAAPMIGGQQVSVHRMKLGAFEVTTLLDGYIDVPTGVLQGDADHIRENLASRS
jgi:D-aminopeptidase